MNLFHKACFSCIIAGTLSLTSSITEAQPVRPQRMKNLGGIINSRGDDFSPSVTADGKFMVFNSRLPEEKIHNIYFSVKRSGTWSKPKFFKVLNSSSNDETPYVTPDGSAIVFSSDRKESVQPSVTSDGRVRITYDVFISFNIKGEWTKPIPIPGDVNTVFNERSPSLSHDMRTLYFTRWPFKRMGEAQIYKARLDGREFLNITPLPKSINSNNLELALVPSQYTEGFYFSSRRKGGRGGWDIYFIKHSKGTFSKPINLGSGVNTAADELFLTEGNGMIYVSSNRSKGFGKFDIYAARIPGLVSSLPALKKPVKILPPPDGSARKVLPPKTAVKTPILPKKIPIPVPKKRVKPKRVRRAPVPGPAIVLFKVTNKKTGKAVRTGFNVYLKTSSSPKAVHKRYVVRNSNSRGILKIRPKKDISWVVVKSLSSRFKTVRSTIKVKQGSMIKGTIELEPLKTKRVKVTNKKGVPKKRAVKKAKPVRITPIKDFTYKPVYFTRRSTALTPGARKYLKRLARHLKAEPRIHLQIIGHGDTRGSKAYNEGLSWKRARAVRSYFKKLGIPWSRVTLFAMGRNYPAAANGSKLERFNSRVEFRIITSKY